MKDSKIKTVNIAPESNDIKIAWNVAYKLFEKGTNK